jgi:hypothetical protein
MAETGALERLAEMDRALRFLVGRSDNLGAVRLRKLLSNTSVGDLGWFANDGNVRQLQDRLAASGHGHQMIWMI